MNIVRENHGEQTSLIKVTVSEADYAAAVEKTLKDYKRKANIPGFRQGMVPMGVVNKMYRKGVVAEESYKVASNACFEYIEKEKIDFVGDVIPSEEQKPFDFDNATEHEFIFEIGEAPEVKLEFGAKDKLNRYKIKVDKKMADGYRTNFLRKYGQLVDVDKVADDEALTVTLDNEEMNVEDAYVGLISMDEKQRKAYKGKKVGDVMDVDVTELYPTERQRAAVLQVKEEELAGINPKFKMTITKIRKFADPEMNEEFFKTAFPDGSVKDEKGLDKYITEQIERELSRETDYVFAFDMRKLLLEKAALKMPEAFLKRWLFTINEGKFTMAEIEQDFAQFLDMMRWNLIMKYFVEKNELKITPEEALEEAKALTLMQFAQYGMSQLPEEMLNNYAQQILSNKDEARKVYDKLMENKVMETVTPLVKVTEKEITTDEFTKIAENLGK